MKKVERAVSLITLPISKKTSVISPDKTSWLPLLDGKEWNSCSNRLRAFCVVLRAPIINMDPLEAESFEQVVRFLKETLLPYPTPPILLMSALIRSSKRIFVVLKAKPRYL